MNDYVPKPVQIADLMTAIERACPSARAEFAAAAQDVQMSRRPADAAAAEPDPDLSDVASSLDDLLADLTTNQIRAA
jgi:FixJ family two-component response regulator